MKVTLLDDKEFMIYDHEDVKANGERGCTWQIIKS